MTGVILFFRIFANISDNSRSFSLENLLSSFKNCENLVKLFYDFQNFNLLSGNKKLPRKKV